jgi:hypothetical protein
MDARRPGAAHFVSTYSGLHEWLAITASFRDDALLNAILSIRLATVELFRRGVLPGGFFLRALPSFFVAWFRLYL